MEANPNPNPNPDPNPNPNPHQEDGDLVLYDKACGATDSCDAGDEVGCRRHSQAAHY